MTAPMRARKQEPYQQPPSLCPSVPRSLSFSPCSPSPVLVQMVYHYVCYWAEVHPELAVLAINTLQKESKDSDPMVRGLALRSLCSLSVPEVKVGSFLSLSLSLSLSPPLSLSTSLTLALIPHPHPHTNFSPSSLYSRPTSPGPSKPACEIRFLMCGKRRSCACCDCSTWTRSLLIVTCTSLTASYIHCR